MGCGLPKIPQYDNIDLMLLFFVIECNFMEIYFFQDLVRLLNELFGRFDQLANVSILFIAFLLHTYNLRD